MTAPLQTLESPDGLAGQSLGSAHCSADVIVAEGYYRLKARVEELEQAIVNIHRWTGSKRCAKECKRVLPDVHQRSQPNSQDQERR